MMKPFTTVNEAVEKAAEFGITATKIANALNISRQNFHNKLKANGSTFTTVHVAIVNNFLEEEFTAVHEKLNHLLNKTFTQVNEPFTRVNETEQPTFTRVNETEQPTFTRVNDYNKGIDEEKLKQEYAELQKQKLANPDDKDDNLSELPF